MAGRSHRSLEAVAPDGATLLIVLPVPFKRCFSMELANFLPQGSHDGGLKQNVVVVRQNAPCINIAGELPAKLEQPNLKIGHPRSRFAYHRCMFVTCSGK